MAAANDTIMADVSLRAQTSDQTANLIQTPHSDAFAFSNMERRALELYDELRELELQKSLIEAQMTAHVPDVSVLSDDELQEQLIAAQREAMDAKAKYEIRNRISHNVLVMDPVLKAVHGGQDSDFAEKRLLPLVTENDTLSMLHGSLASKLTSTARALSAAEQENMAANQENRQLSSTLLALAEEMKAQSTEDIEDPGLRDQVKAVEKQLKDSRRRMQSLKGILSAMIVGSGLDWAADEMLRELVMDDDD